MGRLFFPHLHRRLARPFVFADGGREVGRRGVVGTIARCVGQRRVARRRRTHAVERQHRVADRWLVHLAPAPRNPAPSVRVRPRVRPRRPPAAGCRSPVTRAFSSFALRTVAERAQESGQARQQRLVPPLRVACDAERVQAGHAVLGDAARARCRRNAQGPATGSPRTRASSPSGGCARRWRRSSPRARPARRSRYRCGRSPGARRPPDRPACRSPSLPARGRSSARRAPAAPGRA